MSHQLAWTRTLAGSWPLLRSRCWSWCGGGGLDQNRRYSDFCSTEQECGPCAKHVYMDPKCKVALVTGGTRGIGKAIAHELLCHNLYKVVITGRNPCEGEVAVKDLNECHGKDKCCFFQMDVNCPKQFEDCFKEMTAKFGGVDILVNNAGILNDKKWEVEVDTNIKGTIRGILLAFKYMSSQKQRGGVVINNSSILGLDPFAFGPVYCSTKHAVIGLTKSLGDKRHFQETGVRVVAVCPGVTDTVMIKEAQQNMLSGHWGKEAAATLLGMPMQKPQALGRAVIYMIQYANSGSSWIVEDSQLFKAEIPDRKSFSKKICQL